MSANCELYPTVKKDGAIKTSKLASDLLKKTGDRDKASSIYNRYLSFRDKEHLFDENELDENGQPKLEALLKTDLISKNPKTQDLACDQCAFQIGSGADDRIGDEVGDMAGDGQHQIMVARLH